MLDIIGLIALGVFGIATLLSEEIKKSDWEILFGVALLQGLRLIIIQMK